jgi:hypothetical protein
MLEVSLTCSYYCHHLGQGWPQKNRPDHEAPPQTKHFSCPPRESEDKNKMWVYVHFMQFYTFCHRVEVNDDQWTPPRS